MPSNLVNDNCEILVVHGYIGTEHLLAGLLKEPEGTAGKVLAGI